MTWTTTERYRAYESYSEDELKTLRERVAQSPWHSTFHIEPETGLLNDPNGFSFFNGKWHLFYQHFPFGAVHGLKSWVHLTSTDLVHFEKSGLILYPDTKFENAGAFSGSAFPLDDALFIMYTGNHRKEDWTRIPYQLGAKLDKENQLEKLPEPIIYPNFSETTDHFRDPQIFQHQKKHYMLIGAQSVAEEGKIKIYRSKNEQLTAREDLGFLNFTSEKMGYMIECPNLIFINNTPVLIFCPQGLDQSICSYGNIYPNTYLIADSFSVDKEVRLMGDNRIENLDYGFDCYATQAFNAPDGSAYAISWLGLPDTTYPTDQFGVQGALSMVKKLSVKDGKLYQTPVDEMKTLRKKKKEFLLKEELISTHNVFEMEIDLKSEESHHLNIMANASHESALEIHIDKENDCFTVKRNYEKRTVNVKIEKVNLFIDKSIFEIFINDGEKVLSGRVFPNKEQYFIQSEKPINIKMWELN